MKQHLKKYGKFYAIALVVIVAGLAWAFQDQIAQVWHGIPLAGFMGGEGGAGGNYP